ncbi:MAG: NADH-quinone oxidoreductase subunit J [Candidatus Accumulibacter sp.]|jgi:NADH-quinone oxidoreductase subunit J|uniref:NADH-quinone oxidoreductase subunit J n=1 Tax=Candidatus Accumulibacter TaxID=327159 RepID=UPI001ACCD177|nr:NADH-quinone oxidoreductase subunit J [Accumulibacter sp.]MBK8114930.1 NADH-quinone oxidoreductase subunit J [Accumulibacter sp.]MBK8387256.1 NADH-quinone oxidoreductase subunit J [Accumulibacter sp.]MBK8578382.1 NADH-quinone oxidoreductase subunit J [Candidatus Accumulibacter propinquus]MBN8439400.1 NADH-quinone oxidoreductase subunit J [Accumulibacter sp.]
MEFKTFVFYFLSAILVFAGLRVITSRNPVHAALYLVLAFFTASGVWMLLQAEFLAIALVLVYVGAVMVLFLFVVMMLDINLDRLREGFWSYLPLGAIIGLLMVAEMGLVLGGNYLGLLESSVRQATTEDSNVQAIGRLMFTEYVYPFELASVILLVGIIAAVALTQRAKRTNKSVSPSQQVFVKARDRVRVLQMPAEKSD